MVHFNRGEFEQAAGCFEAVLGEVRDPSDPDHSLALCYAAEARAQLGLAFFHAGQYPRAEEQFNRALEENPSFLDLRYYRARVYERSGRLTEAIADLDRALSDHPRYAEALLLKAVCLGQRDERDGAVEALGAALGLGFELPEELSLTRSSEWRATDWRNLLPRVAPMPHEEPATPMDRALERYHAGDLDAATAELRRAVEERPGYADLRCRLGGLLLELERVDEALEQIDQALRINPRYLEARLLSARARLEHGQPREAIAHLEAAIHAFPDYPDLHFWLGLARFRAGELTAAVEPLERAGQVNRQFARAQRLLGLVYPALGRNDDALPTIRRGLTRDRGLPRESLDAALGLLALGDAAGAEAELTRAVALQPDY